MFAYVPCVVALRLLGYTRRELVGQNIACIVPEPMSSFHQAKLNKFIRSAREVIMKTTRTSFAKHRQGYILPVLINLNTMDGAFMGIMQPLPCQDEFIFYYSKSFVVTAASKGAFALLKVSTACSIMFL